MEKEEVLGFYIYPVPKGTRYTKSNLTNEEVVEELFGYCGILEGIMYPQGWEFLIEYYGCERLYEISQRSLWPDCDSFEEYLLWLSSELPPELTKKLLKQKNR